MIRPDRHFHPEEGRVQLLRGNRQYDMRISVIPTVKGEAVHLRLLSARWGWKSLVELGFGERDSRTIEATVRSQTGLILIAGSTGGGKTTTLYGLTTLMDTTARVIASIEDPVEYTIPGVRQIQADPDHGLTMAQGLKVLLRMDPDMLLVGEIRDSLSAGIAARAALTGGLVAATVHAPNPLGAISALQNLSVPRYILGGALRLIVTQELLPTVCPHCVTQRSLAPDERALFERHELTPPDAVSEAPGCSECRGSGRSGQIAVAEVLPVSQEAGQCIVAGAGPGALAECFHRERIGTLSRNALLRVADGDVPLPPVQRLILARRGTIYPESGF